MADMTIEELRSEVEQEIRSERIAKAKEILLKLHRERAKAQQVADNITQEIEAVEIDVVSGGDGTFGRR